MQQNNADGNNADPDEGPSHPRSAKKKEACEAVAGKDRHHPTAGARGGVFRGPNSDLGKGKNQNWKKKKKNVDEKCKLVGAKGTILANS